MLRIECKYLAKIDVLNSIIDMIEHDDDITCLDDLLPKLRRSVWFYRAQLSELDN